MSQALLPETAIRFNRFHHKQAIANDTIGQGGNFAVSFAGDKRPVTDNQPGHMPKDTAIGVVKGAHAEARREPVLVRHLRNSDLPVADFSQIADPGMEMDRSAFRLVAAMVECGFELAGDVGNPKQGRLAVAM